MMRSAIQLTVVAHGHIRDDLFQGYLLLRIPFVFPIRLLELHLELLNFASSYNTMRDC
jgi:hypothetical protein